MTRRDRSTHNLRNEIVGRFYDNGYFVEMTDLPVSTYYRQIVDYTERNSTQWDPFPGKWRVRPVQYLDYHATNAWWVDWIGHLGKPVTMSPQVRRPLHPDFVTGCVLFLPDEIRDEFCFEAFLEFDTQIKEEIQPLDFLSSLRELGQLIPKLSGNLIKDIASGYLTYEFGWKNFTQDLGHLWNIMSETEKKLQELRDSWGKVTHLVKLKEYDWPQPDQFDEVFYEPRVGYGWRYKLIAFKLQMRIGTYRFHQLQGLDSTINFIRAAGIALGLGSPIKAIWDALPFSFVVDWFTSIGSVLDETRLRHVFDGPWELRHPCHSQKIKAKIAVTQENLPMGRWIGPSQIYPAGEVFVTRYERQFGFPSSRIRSKILELSPKQLLLLAALGTARGA